MIHVENLSKKLNRKEIIKKIDFHLEEGDVLGIIGPNGAGKSTLLSLLGGFMKPDDGSIDIGAHRIGYIPQQLALYEDLSVYENLKLFGAGLELPSETLNEKINEVLHSLKLEENARVKVKKLSGGNQRRVNIGIALMMSPTCLLMDEPVVGVDYKVRSDIERLLKEMSQDGKTLIIASHLKSLISEVCNKILILEDGHVVFFGDVNEEALNKL